MKYAVWLASILILVAPRLALGDGVGPHEDDRAARRELLRVLLDRVGADRNDDPEHAQGQPSMCRGTAAPAGISKCRRDRGH